MTSVYLCVQTYRGASTGSVHLAISSLVLPQETSTCVMYIMIYIILYLHYNVPLSVIMVLINYILDLFL